MTKTVQIPTHIGLEKISKWCETNISRRKYYLQHQNGVDIGGIGWRIRKNPGNIRLTVANEELLVFLLLLM